MKSALTFELKLLEPVLVAAVGAGDENSERSYDFIPGSAILGALARRYASAHSAIEVLDEDDEFRRIFLSGETAFLNAYPLREGQRTLPKPLSWRVSKVDKEREQATLYDFAIDLVKIKIPTAPAGAYAWRRNGDVCLDNTDDYMQVHNASEDRMKKEKGVSAVFRYEAIAAGETLAGAVVGDEKDLKELKRLLEQGDLWLGGSRSGGYGRVQVEVSPDTDADWREYQPDGGESGEMIVVTLLSDAIARDEYGNYSTNPQHLFDARPAEIFQRTRMVGGFNQTWGMPLVQAPAMQAGSVYVFKSGVGMKVNDWEEHGVGERRAEGFGRVAVNWFTKATVTRVPLNNEKEEKNDEEKQEEPKPIELSADSEKLAQRMAERYYRSQLDMVLLSKLATLKIEKPRPSNSQLARLRITVRQTMKDNDLEKIPKHIEDLKSAKTQFERARIDDRRMSDWLKKPDDLWKDYFAKKAPSATLAGVTFEPDESIKTEYVARLIDGLLRSASKSSEGEN